MKWMGLERLLNPCESMHIMVETYLFSKDLENVSPERRVYLANQLRAASLIAKLGEVTVK